MYIDFETCTSYSGTSWNVPVFSTVVRDLISTSRLDWIKVLMGMDVPSLEQVDAFGLNAVAQVYAACCPKEPFPFIQAFCSQIWKNRIAQLSILRVALDSELDVLPRYAGEPQTAKSSNERFNLAWRSPHYVDVLLRLSETDVGIQVKRFFEQACKQNSVLLFRTLTNEESRVTECPLYREILAELADSLFVPSNGNSTLLTLWHDCPKGVVDSMRVLYFSDRSKVSVIVDAAHFQSTNMKNQSEKYLLTALLDSKPLVFAIDVAVLSYQRRFLKLEQWLREKLQQFGSEFLHATLEFLREKYDIKVVPGGTHTRGGANGYILQETVFQLFIDFLKRCMTQDAAADFQCFISEFNSMNKSPQQQQQQPPVDSETQRLTNDSREFIKRIYNCEITPEDGIEILRTRPPLFIRFVGEYFSNIMNLANQDEKIIDLFSQCFGLMVTNGLLPNWDSILLDAFQKDDPILNRFKSNVLLIIQTILPRSWRFCEQLAHFPMALQKCYPLQKIIAHESLLMSADEALKIALEKSSFKINNMTAATIKEDAAVIKSQFTDFKVFPSAVFVRDLILPHVARDTDAHNVYETLLKLLAVPDLFDEAARETAHECLKVIRDNLDNLDDRRTQETLRNLGHWLGRITLARGRAVPRDLHLKYILMQNMTREKEVLHVVVCFVCSILTHASGQAVFMPPNPWMVPLLTLMVQIYDRPDVKQFTKFEIDDLFGSNPDEGTGLNLDMAKFRVTPSKDDILTIFRQEQMLARNRNSPELQRMLDILYHSIQEFRASFNGITIARNCIRTTVLKDLAEVADEKKLRQITETMMMTLAHNSVQFAISDKLRILRAKGEHSPEFESLFRQFLTEEYTKVAQNELEELLKEPILARKQFKQMVASGELPKNAVFQDLKYCDPLSCFKNVDQAAVVAFYERPVIPGQVPQMNQDSADSHGNVSMSDKIAVFFGEKYLAPEKQQSAQAAGKQMLDKMKDYGDARYFIDNAVIHAEMACTQDWSVRYGKVGYFVSCLQKMFHMVRVADKAAAASQRSAILRFALDGFKASLIEHCGTDELFDQRPYQLLLNMIMDIVYTDNLEFDLAKPPTLQFYNLLLELNPGAYPCFAFAWLDLISHKRFMSNLLAYENGENAKELLILLLSFMEPYLRSGILDDCMKQIYIGTLRLFVSLMHEGAELLVSYYTNFCDVLPMNAVQLRNIILSALLPSVKVPPHIVTSGLKIDSIPGIRNPPPLPPHCVRVLEDAHIIPDLDTFLSQGTASPNFDKALMSLLRQPQQAMKYNIPALNAFALQCAITVTSANGKPQNALALFKSLLCAFDFEGRMLLFNAMVNQLRFPNSHTLFYTHLLLKLFQSDLDNTIKDQLVRTVAERLLARPQPVGLMAFYRELVSDPEFEKYSVTLLPEVRQVLDSFKKALAST